MINLKHICMPFVTNGHDFNRLWLFPEAMIRGFYNGECYCTGQVSARVLFFEICLKVIICVACDMLVQHMQEEQLKNR